MYSLPELKQFMLPTILSSDADVHYHKLFPVRINFDL